MDEARPSLVRPLGCFAFASTADAGSEHPRLEALVQRSRPALDVSAVAARILFTAPVRAQSTPYLGVSARSLRSASAVVPAAVPATSIAEAARQLRRLCEDAFERSVGGARAVVVMTGGGLDSSALLAMAVHWAKRTGGRAFGAALDFGGPGDDRPYLRALERHLRCEVLRIRPEDAAPRFSDVQTGVDAAPFTWPSGPMEVELMARARAAGADLALMGVGADELLDGQPRSLAEVARSGRIVAAVRQARALRGFLRPKSPVAAWVLRPLIAAALPSSLRRWRNRRAPSGGAVVWAGPALQSFRRARSIANASAAAQTSPSTHLEHLTWLQHQEEVASGLPRESPFADARLVGFVRALPRPWLLHRGVRRGLFREAMRDLLPSAILNRDGKAEFAPASARFVASVGGFDALRSLATADELARLELVDPERFREAFEAFALDPIESNGWATVWPALAVEAFLRARSGLAVR